MFLAHIRTLFSDTISFLDSLIHSFNKCVLSSDYMSFTVPGTGKVDQLSLSSGSSQCNEQAVNFIEAC